MRTASSCKCALISEPEGSHPPWRLTPWRNPRSTWATSPSPTSDPPSKTRLPLSGTGVSRGARRWPSGVPSGWPRSTALPPGWTTRTALPRDRPFPARVRAGAEAFLPADGDPAPIQQVAEERPAGEGPMAGDGQRLGHHVHCSAGGHGGATPARPCRSVRLLCPTRTIPVTQACPPTRQSEDICPVDWASRSAL